MKNVHADTVEMVREFNRYYTKKIGALNEGLVSSEFSLAEVRVLYELANRQIATAKEIAQELEIDAGYLSRIIRKFEERKFLRRDAADDDARQSILTLTKNGTRAFNVLRLRSIKQVEAMLSSLERRDQTRLAEAMQSIKELLDPTVIPSQQTSEPYVLRTHGPGDIGYIIHRHGAIYAKDYQWDETFEALVAEIAAKFVREFDPKYDRCWIAERDDQFLGTIMCVKSDSPGTAKLRLLLVEETARGIGVGKRLVKECMKFATNAGYKKLSLWTQQNLIAARKLYVAAGFKLVKEEPHHSFGHDLTGEHWEVAL
jgi:DNA-binding MarR family transcriptional regulator/GNAT superfamily N-acetyltransferase